VWKLAIAIPVLLFPFVVYFVIEFYRADLAENRVFAAWRVLGPQTVLTTEFYNDNDIPIALRTKEEIAVYWFLEAARLDAKSSAAYYNLGKYFLSRDCQVARQYFERHAALIPNDEDTKRVLGAIELEGCKSAMLVLQ